MSNLFSVRSVEELRDNVAAHNAGFDPARLRRIAIIGAAGEGQRLVGICKAQGIEVVALADGNPEKIGTTVADSKVVPIQQLKSLDRSTPIIIASHRVLNATKEFRGLGFTCVLPFAALQVLAPKTFPPHMFYENWLEDLFNNRDKYRRLSSDLADDKSRDVLCAVLGFRQTVDPIVLAPVVEESLYLPEGIFTFGDKEIYVDGGSYDGDTIRTFAEGMHGRFEHVYAFEPDPRTFAKLESNFAHEPRVEPINAGLYREKSILRFRDDASRGAIFSNDGEIEMAVVALDDVLGDKRVSYIKMNIEGAEIDALYGARRSIQRWSPKLAISAYHRASDLWRVPEVIRSLNPNYELYLRQQDGGVIETVLYARAKEGRLAA